MIIAGSSNGRTPTFGVGYEGPIPSPAVMDIGWWFQLLGLLAGLLSAIFLILGFIVTPPPKNIFRSINNLFINQVHYGVGDNIAGNKIIQRKLFSDTQYIKFWPFNLGGNDRLNLDNVATMKRGNPSNENTITMFLNVVPVEETPRKVEGKFEIKDIQFFQYNDSQKYIFDRDSNRSHRITIERRTFIVILNKIKKMAIQGISDAIEYEFGISEVE